MGSVIEYNNKGESTAALTETGKGGLFSSGYLREAPAETYVGEGETPVFVLATADGVERERDADTDDDVTVIDPGDGYRTILVATDRRVLVLVGAAEDDGSDRRISLPFVEVAAVDVDDGLSIIMRSGGTWHLPAEGDDAATLAEYLEAAASAWDDLEDTLDAVKRDIVSATAARDEGDYEAALETMRAARDALEVAAETATAFGDVWTGTAMTERIQRVRNRCLETAAEVRVGYGRTMAHEAERHWRAEDYEAAYDAYDDALRAVGAVTDLDACHRRHLDGVEDERERIERAVERLEEAPLRAAVEAERRAEDSEDPVERAAGLALARDRFSIALEVDSGRPERRFTGERAVIHERREQVTDRLVDLGLDDGVDHLEAGEWYRETDRPDLAREELATARPLLALAHETAEEDRPQCVTELSLALGRVDDHLAQLGATEAVDSAVEVSDAVERPDALPGDTAGAEGPVGPEPGPSDAIVAPAATGRVEAPDGGVRTVPAGPAGPDGAPADPVPAAARSFDRRVRALVESMGWEPADAVEEPVDLLAEREGESGGRLAVVVHGPDADGPVDAATIGECADVRTELDDVTEVLLVTDDAVDATAAAAARDAAVCVVDATEHEGVPCEPGPDGAREVVDASAE